MKFINQQKKNIYKIWKSKTELDQNKFEKIENYLYIRGKENQPRTCPTGKPIDGAFIL